jgi:hypothetical protein
MHIPIVGLISYYNHNYFFGSSADEVRDVIAKTWESVDMRYLPPIFLIGIY